MFMIKSHCF